MPRKLKNTSGDADRSLTIPTIHGAAGLSFPGPVVDNLRYMLARIGREQAPDAPLPRRLGLVSALRGEGVSYLAQALGGVIAHDMPGRTCVVELNLHWPSATPFAEPGAPGLAGVLEGWSKLEDALCPTGWPNLTVLPAGRADADKRPVLARGQALRDTLTQLEAMFDYIILDLPAVLATSDAVPLAGLADGICLVVRQGLTPDSDVKAALDEIRHLPMLGVVLNQASYATPSGLASLLVGHD